MTDNEIIKAFEWVVNCNGRNVVDCIGCPLAEFYPCCEEKALEFALDLINRQKAEIESIRRKALLEAASKFTGHSNYHGDTILCKLICMAEGKEVGNARPLDMEQIKAEAYKEFADIVKANKYKFFNYIYSSRGFDEQVDNILKEMEGGK